MTSRTFRFTHIDEAGDWPAETIAVVMQGGSVIQVCTGEDALTGQVGERPERPYRKMRAPRWAKPLP